MVEPGQLIGLPFLGRYRVKRDRGAGCHGSLFLAAPMGQALLGGAFEDQVKSTVVLEVIPDGRGYDQRQVDDLGALQPHPGLLECREIGQIDDGDLAGAAYVVWEAWENSLAGIFSRRSPMDQQEIRTMAKEIAAALARYHSDNCAHGDVRAERICQVRGHWKLMPALRRRTNGNGAITASEATAQDDIYALGLTLLSCLSPAFAQLRARTPHQPASWPQIEQALRPLPETWRHWLGRCLAANPRQRCSAAEMALMDAEMPAPVAEVFVDRGGDQYRLQWQPPDRGTVQVYRWTRSRCPAQGEIWLRADLERNAEIVPLTPPATVYVQLAPGTACQILVATLVGDAAVIGDSFVLTWAADVQGLQVSVEAGNLVAAWDWPEEVYDTQVVVRQETFPTGPDDPDRLTRKRCFRAGYTGRLVIPIQQDVGVVHVTVYAKYPREDGWEYACGRTTGARQAVTVVPIVRLHYWVEKVSLLARWLLGAEPCRLCVRASRTATLPELALVACESNLPADTVGELPVLHVPAQRYEQGTVFQKDFRLPEGVRIEDARLLVPGKTREGVWLVPERRRAGKLSA